MGAAPEYACRGGTDFFFIDSRPQNADQLNRIDLVLELSDESERVHDAGCHFNLYRRGLDYFWFSTGPYGGGLQRYQERNEYSYDIYALIEDHRPVVISRSGIPNLSDPRIKRCYKATPEYPDLLVRMAR